MEKAICKCALSISIVRVNVRWNDHSLLSLCRQFKSDPCFALPLDRGRFMTSPKRAGQNDPPVVDILFDDGITVCAMARG